MRERERERSSGSDRGRKKKKPLGGGGEEGRDRANDQNERRSYHDTRYPGVKI